MKLVVVAHDIPYPPIHGGRVDIWNRSAALAHFGAELYLVAWHDAAISLSDLAHLHDVYTRVSLVRRNRNPVRALHPILATQMHSMSRKKRDAIYRELDEFSPHAVILDGLGGLTPAKWISSRYGAPLYYRSHNVEHRYISSLLRASSSWIERAKLLLNIPRTLRAERIARRDSQKVFDISPADLEYWKDTEPNWEAELLRFNLHPSTALPDFGAEHFDQDVLFLGNLSSPNNLRAVKWLLDNVAPDLAGMRIAIAGSRPSKETRDEIARHNVRLLVDVHDPHELFARSAVIVNPILHGSGMNIKMVEMLMSGRPVVSTTLGARGLPTELLSFVRLHDNPAQFAQAILNASSERTNPEQRACTESYFSWRNLKNFLRDLELRTTEDAA